ncbi:MAG: glutamine-hydrolyzing carbamoyl-phosphate synthase small subunit [Bacteroidales bacterium]
MSKDKKVAKLILEDGTVMTGYSFGAETSVAGEVVFSTAMVGYPESLTDPSYKGQILVLTYPMVGNYGIPHTIMENGLPRFFESDRIHISGLIITDYSYQHNHWNAAKSLADWLKEYNVPGVFGIDTRALTKQLREKGTMLGKIVIDDQDVPLYDPNKDNLVAQVSTKERIVYGNGKFKVLLIDTGVKYNIIRNLLKRDVTVVRVPWDYDIFSEEFDGLFISNGPGDPKMCTTTIKNLKQALDYNIPTMGICLGNQLLGLAAGADTYKLKYGHRSHNQPVIEVGTQKAYITSQNHGFAIDNNTLSDEWEPLFINLNDNTNEGMRHKTKPFFSCQFHPEATGGPVDTEFLFDVFVNNIEKSKKAILAI